MRVVFFAFLTIQTIMVFVYTGYKGYYAQKTTLGIQTSKKQLYVTTPTITHTLLPQKDIRIKKLEKYFTYRASLNRHTSPLASIAAYIVQTADQYRIDYRLIPAIATIESNQCKVTPLRDPLNCWGWGIYPNSVKEPFTTYQEGVKTVSHGLAKNYVHKGYNELVEIAHIYNPNTPEIWAEKMQKIFNFIESQ